jgi:hypothetical protein
MIVVPDASAALEFLLRKRESQKISEVLMDANTVIASEHYLSEYPMQPGSVTNCCTFPMQKPCRWQKMESD